MQLSHYHILYIYIYIYIYHLDKDYYIDPTHNLEPRHKDNKIIVKYLPKNKTKQNNTIVQGGKDMFSLFPLC